MHQPVRRAKFSPYVAIRERHEMARMTSKAASANSMKSIVEKPIGLFGGRAAFRDGAGVACKIEYITDIRPIAVRSTNDAQYLPALTGLRFLLGMWVILHHLTSKGMLLDQWNQTLPFALQSIFRGGYLAVQTFFLLSGFVLAQSYAATRWNRRSLAKFAMARFARIYPAYLLSLVLISWFVIEFLLKPGRSMTQKATVLGDYAFVLQGWTGSLAVGWNTPAWSLSCEFFFYLCFPLLFLWLRGGGLARILPTLAACFVVPILLAQAGVPGVWKPIHHLSDFVAGIAAARIYGALLQSGMATKVTRRLGFWLTAGALAAGAGLIVSPHVLDGTVMTLNTVLRPLNVALLIGLATGGGFVVRLLSTDVAGYLGKASYSMYILHIPLLWWFSRYTFFRFGATPPAWAGFLFMAAVIGVSIAAFEFVETPANRWIRDWTANRMQPAPPSVMRAAA
jgi:peptidoglycan/LPS O-acetylase OafA/YrhL